METGNAKDSLLTWHGNLSEDVDVDVRHTLAIAYPEPSGVLTSGLLVFRLLLPKCNLLCGMQGPCGLCEI